MDETITVQLKEVTVLVLKKRAEGDIVKPGAEGRSVTDTGVLAVQYGYVKVGF
jgi:hypothetical protein